MDQQIVFAFLFYYCESAVLSPCLCYNTEKIGASFRRHGGAQRILYLAKLFGSGSTLRAVFRTDVAHSRFQAFSLPQWSTSGRGPINS